MVVEEDVNLVLVNEAEQTVEVGAAATQVYRYTGAFGSSSS